MRIVRQHRMEIGLVAAGILVLAATTIFVDVRIAWIGAELEAAASAPSSYSLIFEQQRLETLTGRLQILWVGLAFAIIGRISFLFFRCAGRRR
ncbi:MAG: hypothetical protein ACYDCI_02930 [Candidatus Limnocylindrales bacterium]